MLCSQHLQAGALSAKQPAAVPLLSAGAYGEKGESAPRAPHPSLQVSPGGDCRKGALHANALPANRALFHWLPMPRPPYPQPLRTQPHPCLAVACQAPAQLG